MTTEESHAIQPKNGSYRCKKCKKVDPDLQSRCLVPTPVSKPVTAGKM